VLLACDGIWDVKTSQDAVNYLNKQIYKDYLKNKHKKKTIQDLIKGVENLMDECCAKDLGKPGGLSDDNMTVILVEIW
jgi:serine/threonine protein phosphatase PrpC